MELSTEAIWQGELPDDVMLEILSRLPPKPFFRFKCVSKSWLALSSQASRLNKHLQPTLIDFVYDTPLKPKINIGFTNISDGVYGVDMTVGALPPDDDFFVLDCCNGLVLVKCWDYGSGRSYSSNYLYVYNPATRKHTAINLLPDFSWPYHGTISLALAFDHRDHSQFHVVCFRHTYCDRGCENIFYTFSSISGRWQQGGNLGSDKQISDVSKGTFLDGRVHRVTEGHEIVSVDVNKNTCIVTKYDFPGLPYQGLCDIGQSQGHLHFMYVQNFRWLSIWVSENGDLQKWTLKHKFHLEQIPSSIVHARICQMIVLHPEKDVLFRPSENGYIESIMLGTGKSNKFCAIPHQILPVLRLYRPCFFF